MEDILLTLPIDKIYTYCYSGLANLFDETYWKNRYIKDFENIKDVRTIEDVPSENSKDKYIQNLTNSGNITYGSEKYLNIEECLIRSAVTNDIYLFKYFILKGANNHDLALMEASKYACDDIIGFLLDNFPDINLNWGLKGSVKGNDPEMVRYYIEKGATDIDGAYGIACLEGNTDLINYLESEGVKSFALGFENACRGGHLDLVKKFKNMSIPINDDIYMAALDSKNKQIMKLVEKN